MFYLDYDSVKRLQANTCQNSLNCILNITELLCTLYFIKSDFKKANVVTLNTNNLFFPMTFHFQQDLAGMASPCSSRSAGAA